MHAKDLHEFDLSDRIKAFADMSAKNASIFIDLFPLAGGPGLFRLHLQSRFTIFIFKTLQDPQKPEMDCFPKISC